MKCFINGKEFNVVEGATFSEEYNEKLDSGAIILSQVPRQNFKQYDDVYIYNDEFDFKGVGRKKRKNILKVDTIQDITYTNEEQLDLYNSITAAGGSLGIRLTGQGVFAYLDWWKNYTSETEKYCVNDFKSDLIIHCECELVSTGSDTNIAMQVGFSHSQNENAKSISFVVFATYYALYGNIEIENNNATINFGVPANCYIINTNTGERYARVKSISINANENPYTRRTVNQNYTYSFYYVEDPLSTSYEASIISERLFLNGNSEKNNIVGTINPIDVLSFGSLVFRRVNSSEFQATYAYSYSAIASESFTNSNPMINFTLQVLTLSWNERPELINNPRLEANFYRHLLIDSFSEERLNLNEDLYKYKITLFSETKRLETITCPNLSITQPLNFSKKKSIYDYLVQYLELFNPKIKVSSTSSDYWYYDNKYTYAERVKTKFESIIAPDFSLNNPTFRDLLNQLMIVADCIPIVRDNEIDYLDLSERKGLFDTNKTNYYECSVSSNDYAQNLKKNYNDGLSTQNARYVEKLGFRNSEQGLMTLENMRIETRFPIYKINKIYMCYYKKYSVYYLNENGIRQSKDYIMLVKQDITPLVKLNSERNLLSTDWLELSSSLPSSVEALSQYKLATVGYDIGSNFITGWGTIYSYPIQNSWFDTTKSYIENIITFMDGVYPFGVNNAENIKKYVENGLTVDTNESWVDSVVVPNSPQSLQTSDPLKMKCLFFEIEYNSFYNGTIIHSKDNDYGDITINDNPSNSLTLLESDGSFEKEKLNRVGNKIYQINARYDIVEELQELGSVFEDDNVIYHREYSIYNNLVKCNYYATKDYVMKNYFTSIWAKHRTYNLMSYNESIVRAENRKMFLYLSLDEEYNEREKPNGLSFNLSNEELIEQLASAFVPNEQLTSKNDFVYYSRINYGYFKSKETSFSDVNTFTSGTSLIFNVRMFDNVSGGVKINQIAPDTGIIDPNDDYTKGSTQQWLLCVDDIETGQIQELEVAIAHIDNSEIYHENAFEFDQSIVNNIYQNYLYGLPQVKNDLITNYSILIKWNGNIYKDNKEQIDFTFQIEPITKSNHIAFSSSFMMLSDLVNYFYKNLNDYSTIYSSITEDNFIILGFSTWDKNIAQVGFNYNPEITISIPNIASINANDTIYFNYDGYNNQYLLSVILVDARIIQIQCILSDFIVSSINDNELVGTINVQLRAASAWWLTGHFNTLFDIKTQINITLNRASQDYSSEYKTYRDRIDLLEESLELNAAWLRTFQYISFPVKIGASNDKFGGWDSPNDASKNDFVYASAKYNEITNYKKNMYVFYRNKGNIKESKLIDKFSNTPNNLIKIESNDIQVNELFVLTRTSSGELYIDTNISEMDYFENIFPKTLEYWFYNDTNNSYNFVFGVDMFNELKVSDNIEWGQSSINIYKGENAGFIHISKENIREQVSITSYSASSSSSTTYEITTGDNEFIIPSGTDYITLSCENKNIFKYLSIYRYFKHKRVYLSLVSNLDTRVYDENSLLVGNILNYVDSNEHINDYQIYNKNV